MLVTFISYLHKVFFSYFKRQTMLVAFIFMFIKLCKVISKVMAGVKMIIDLEDNIMKIQICQCVAEIYKKFPFRNLWKNLCSDYSVTKH